MSRANMLVPTNLMGVQIPNGYMLVQQISSNPNAAPNSNPRPTFGKNWSRNQRKRERREQLGASRGANPARDSTHIQPPTATGVGSTKSSIAQPTGPVAAEVELSSSTHPGAERDKVENESTANHSGYYTGD